MNALFAGGAVLDWLIAGMLAEAAALLLLYRLRRRGVAPGRLLPNLAAGLCLVFAMRLALGGAWWGYVSAALLAALGCHLTELRRSWQ